MPADASPPRARHEISMPAETNHVSVSGSSRAPFRGATVAGTLDPKEPVHVTVRIRRRHPLPSMEALGTRRPSERVHMTPEEFEANHGADPADIEKVEEFAARNGLSVVESSIPRRSVVLAGTVETASSAFGVNLQRYQYGNESYRGRTGEVHVPADLSGIVEGVFGLDNRPQAEAHHQWKELPATAPDSGSKGGATPAMQDRSEGPMHSHAAAAQPLNPANGFNPNDVGHLYNFPAGVNGHGQCIAIIELGGGFRHTDITQYFASLGLAPPSVTAVSVDGGHNTPSTPNSADGEVALDIEVAGAVAPGARVAVYFAPNTDQGFIDAITKAIHDPTRKPSVISISWGAAENEWTPQAMHSMDQAFQSAAALGVTICVASGDRGSTDGVSDGHNHVDFPASSPYALGCGGTRLVTSGPSTITQETVWNDNPTQSASGGGVSTVFPRPSWQGNVHANGGAMAGRGVPDVSGDADPQTGYRILVDGQQGVIGGTSAVAPLWAGLVALLNQKLGHHVGYLNPTLYNQLPGTGSIVDITTGNNGGFHAKQGWDACTGWGRPNGTVMATHL